VFLSFVALVIFQASVIDLLLLEVLFHNFH
jgi:hypothetical protein